MRITEKFRNKIIDAMPELSQELAQQIADIEQCSTATVYTHWRKLKNLDGDLSTIMLTIAKVAADKKAANKKQVEKIMRQLSAA
jgi:hypothetical protein